jgi:hypothetical protein
VNARVPGLDAAASGSFPACTSARTTSGETATLNRAMTIPVTLAARPAKPEAPGPRRTIGLITGFLPSYAGSGTLVGPDVAILGSLHCRCL